MSYQGNEITNHDNGNLLIGLNCFKKLGGFNNEGIKYYTGKIEHDAIVNGDILIANTDVTREGEVIGYPIEIAKLNPTKIAVHSMDTSKIAIRNDDICKLFLYYFLCTNLSRNCMKAFSAGTTVLHFD